MSQAQTELSEFEIKQLSRRFETAGVEEILEWAAERFSPRLAMTSNFGAEGVVLIDHVARVAPRTPIIYLETGFQFAETDHLKERLRARYGSNIIERRAALSIEEQNRIYGERLYERDPDLCCRIRKVEPLKRYLAGMDAWVSGLRRDQNVTRESTAKVELDFIHGGIVKVNPIADWTHDQVMAYVQAHNVPVNRLHAQGYPSVGCEPCSRAVRPGDDPRSGRWWWERPETRECGIHVPEEEQGSGI